MSTSKKRNRQAASRLKKADVTDAPALTELFLAARGAAMPHLPRLYSDAETLAWMEAMIRSGQEMSLAVRRGRVEGFVVRSGERVEHLYVAPTAQGQGLGTLLLDGEKRQAVGLTLRVFQRNLHARAFYERRGFRLMELSDGEANEEDEPDALYRWDREP